MRPTHDKWLERWKRYYDSLSSPLVGKQHYDRQTVDIVYFMLLEFWGSDFFEFDFLQNMKKNTLHFIQSLVYRPSVPGFYRLYEVCILLQYAHDYNKEQYKILTACKYQSEKMRDTLCEVLLEYSFRQAGIEYAANPIRGRQTLEGYCKLNGEGFLVECKNKYSMNKDEFKIICYVSGRLMEFGQQPPPFPLLGVGYISFKHKDIIETDTYNVFKKLIDYLSTNSQVHIGGVIEDDHVRIEMKSGTDENFAEYDSGGIQANLKFYIKPTHEVDDKGNFIVRFHVDHSSSAKRSDLSEKLKTTIRKARSQHKEETARGRIIVVVNEFLLDFRPPLLVDCSAFAPDVSSYLASKSTDDIVILLDRRFNLLNTFIQPHILGKDHLLLFKKLLAPIDYSCRKLLYPRMPF
jgi:hypothetical protein